MKDKILFLICCLLFSPIGKAEGEPPLAFWSANKAGKTIYMLGTVHRGLSLEDYQCAPGIKSLITDSELLFVEATYPVNYSISVQDSRTLFIGSELEKQLVLEKIPEQDRDNVREAVESRKNLIDWNLLRPNIPVKIESKESAVFEDLSSKSQEFLIKHGFQQSKYNSEELLKEIAYFINLTALYDASYGFRKFLDSEVKHIAKKKAVPVRSLDNKKLDSEEQIQDIMSKKPIFPVGINDVELMIDNYEETRNSNVDFLILVSQQVLHFMSLTLNGNASSGLTLGEDFDEFLFKDRNVIWVEKIIESLEEEENNKIFVAGGAWHFIGADNVIDMLKDKEFEITRFYCSGESIQP